MDSLLEELQNQGRRDSSGRFSLDLRRLLPTLGRYQLAHPDRCILRLLAAAVAAGATEFRYRAGPRGYAVEFDGQPLSDGDLERLFQCMLSGGEPRLGELAIALNTARAHGARAVLEAAGGRLVLEGEAMTLDSSPASLTRVEFSWAGLKQRARRAWVRTLNVGEAALLATHGAWAPLKLEAGPPYLPRCDRAIRVGEPPVCKCSVPVAQAALGDLLPGAGYLLLNTYETTFFVVVNGVRYRDEPLRCPGATAFWWNSELTLDLSRDGLVHDEARALFRQQLEMRMVDELLLQPGDIWRRRLADQVARFDGVDDDFQAHLRDLPLFPRANGSFGSWNQLRSQYALCGFLAHSTRLFQATAWNPDQVWLEGEPFHAVQSFFPHRLALTPLAEENPPRLPEARYLARIPCLDGSGEIGLRTGPHRSCQRLWQEGSWKEQTGALYSVDAALLPGRQMNDVTAQIPELYFSLAQQRHPEGQLDLVAAHLLDFLVGASKSLGGHGLKKLLGGPRLITYKGSRKQWGPLQFRAVAQAVRLRTVKGSSLPLEALLGGERFYVAPGWNPSDPPPPGTLVLTPQMVGRLEALLRPARRLDSWAAAHNLTPAARELLRLPVRAKAEFEVFQAMRAQAKGTGAEVLRSLALQVREPETTGSMVELGQRAGEIARMARVMVSTEHVLLALLESPWLRDQLPDPAPLRRALAERRCQEALAATDSPLRRAWCLLSLGRAREALTHTRDSAFRAAHGCALALQGDFAGAAELLGDLTQGPVQPHGKPFMATVWADLALCQLELGQVEAATASAGQACALQQNGRTLTVRGRVALARRAPASALHYAEQALQGRAPASAHELRALALAALGRTDGVADSFARFLDEVELHGLVEPRLPERLEAARRTQERGA